jgi:ABC-type dipeptide/oligopeptide/nickel transport system permease component
VVGYLMGNGVAARPWHWTIRTPRLVLVAAISIPVFALAPLTAPVIRLWWAMMRYTVNGDFSARLMLARAAQRLRPA